MIPHMNILAWQERAPWINDAQIEQDLILSRILVELFSDEFLRQELAFRGGTALHKLFFNYPLRYSEDIDLVRTGVGPIGKIIDVLREKLDPWLGKSIRESKERGFKIYYKFATEIQPIIPMRIKIEINTRECFNLLGIKQKHFSVDNPWFTGNAAVTTYELEELLATKLRALYQRNKGRDLFDLATMLETNSSLDVDKIIQCFEFYLAKEGKKISAEQFTSNIEEKLKNPRFTADIQPLLAKVGFPMKFPIKFYPSSSYTPLVAAAIVQKKIISRMR